MAIDIEFLSGKILHASSLGTHILVLNKLEDAVELLENRSYKYSDRPYSPIINMFVLLFVSFTR